MPLLLVLLLVPILIGAAIYGISLIFSPGHHHQPLPTPSVLIPPTSILPDTFSSAYRPPLPTFSYATPPIFSAIPRINYKFKDLKDDNISELKNKDEADEEEGPIAEKANVDEVEDGDESEDEYGDHTGDGHGSSKQKISEGNETAEEDMNKNQKANEIEDKEKKAAVLEKSDESTVARGIADNGIITDEKDDLLDESSQQHTTKDANDEGSDKNDQDDEDDDEYDEDEADLTRRSVKKADQSQSRQRHHHHLRKVSQKGRVSARLSRRGIAIEGKIESGLRPTRTEPLGNQLGDADDNDLEDSQFANSLSTPTLSLKDIIAIIKSASIPLPVKTMYPLEGSEGPALNKRRARTEPHSKDSTEPRSKDKKSGKKNKTVKKNKKIKDQDEVRAEDLEEVINEIVDEQSASLQNALSHIATKLAKSPELEQHRDFLKYLSNTNFQLDKKVAEEGILDLGVQSSRSHSRTMAPEQDLGPDDQRLLLFRNPETVSQVLHEFGANFNQTQTASVSVALKPTQTTDLSSVTPTPSSTPAPPSPFVLALLKAVNIFAAPLILQLRADIRNLLFWLCSSNPGPHIDGKNSSGDDSEARQLVSHERATLVQPDGSVEFKEILDPRLVPTVLGCLKHHWDIFVKEILDLFWKRFTSAKEFLVDQIRALIGLPQYLTPFLLGALGELDPVKADPAEGEHQPQTVFSSQEQQEPEQVKVQSETTSSSNVFVPPPPISAAFKSVIGQVHKSANVNARVLFEQSAEAAAVPVVVKGGDEFVSWVADSIFKELSFFFNAGQQAGYLNQLKMTDSDTNEEVSPNDDGRSLIQSAEEGGKQEVDASQQQCLFMKENIVKALNLQGREEEEEEEE
ncbi:hypothetical protein BGZ83_005857 [Gryganskiella cystojenkinii]|nr:hypothetical protein BGZ83_005857 [Gryganskiella cystojenkinii]